MWAAINTIYEKRRELSQGLKREMTTKLLLATGKWVYHLSNGRPYTSFCGQLKAFCTQWLSCMCVGDQVAVVTERNV